MRGREGQPGRVERGTGITPAYAGKSRPAVIIAGHFRDHPRVCGEERKRKKLTGWQRGSPPRMRGRGRFPTLRFRHIGITPAYAGKSFRHHGREYVRQDHPRVCGEEEFGQQLVLQAEGSPPRMRGRAVALGCVLSWLGITPAYAGKRAPFQKMSTLGRDHPRVCGEEAPKKKKSSHGQGSPPRMRGRAVTADFLLLKFGITPAYAGKSHPATPTTSGGRDHPRVCGEELSAGGGICAGLGSPPRMRGRASGSWKYFCAIGITPAYAGKSSPSQPFSSACRDHPRVCGEETKKIP